jgi:hypothetical protein
MIVPSALNVLIIFASVIIANFPVADDGRETRGPAIGQAMAAVM